MLRCIHIKERDTIVWVKNMIKTIAELVSMKVNDKDFIEREGAKIIVEKSYYETFFKINKNNTSYAKCTSVPNTLLVTIANDACHFKTVSNRTCTILYYMSGYKPKMTVRQLTTIDTIIGGLLYD